MAIRSLNEIAHPSRKHLAARAQTCEWCSSGTRQDKGIELCAEPERRSNASRDAQLMCVGPDAFLWHACSPGIAAAMARVHSYEWVQDALLDGHEDDGGQPLSRAWESCLATHVLPCC